MKAACLTSAAGISRPLHSLAAAVSVADDSLPDEYFRRLSKWCTVVRAKLQTMPDARLAALEAQRGWYHFPYTILASAVLYAKPNRANKDFGNPAMLELTTRIGDLLVREDVAGTFSPRLDSYRDLYMWLEAYGLVKQKLTAQQDQVWRIALERNVRLLVPDLQAWSDVAEYTENFLGTSPNHFAWWSATVMTGGLQLGKPEWVELGRGILYRFATTEQNPDGYWGEHNRDSPTAGYNYLTTLAVGLLWEHTRSPQALEALRRATNFHAATTFGDGNLIDLFNDRNRYWEVSPWGQFAFTHFPVGRRYAQMLTRNIPDTDIDLDTLGLLAQNALYYHAGPSVACPQEQRAYAYRLAAPAGVRKVGPWTVAMCGIVDTPLPRSQWFLDRQANLAIFHDRAGLIVSGASSKHQPELATFAEKIDGEWVTKPKGGRLTQSDAGDVLAVAHNTFSAEIHVPPPVNAREQEVEFRINGRGPVPDETYLGLQLCLKTGMELQALGGRSVALSAERMTWSADELRKGLRCGVWSIQIDSDATLEWPIYPYSPYINGLEKKLDHAVGLLRVPLKLKADPNHWLQINERVIRMRVIVDAPA